MTSDAGTADTVSVLGIGEMGAALARALLAAGLRVTVWNRSVAKCLALQDAGATVAATALDAVRASAVIVTCVSDFDVLKRVVHVSQVADEMRGKTLIQLTTRTPAEARTGADWAQKSGIDCLEGAIFAYPPAIGTADATLVLSGPARVFGSMKKVLDSLSGAVLHAGEDMGSAAALDLGVVGTFVPGAVLSFLQGAALCTAEGASLDTYLSLVEHHAYPKLALAMMKIGVPMMKSGRYEYRGEGAPLGVWLAGLELACSAAESAGINVRFSQAVTSHLREAVAQGHGHAEMPAIFEQMRNRSDVEAHADSSTA